MEDDLELIYAENIVSQLFSWKTAGRAKKGHQMVDASLHTILSEEIIESAILIQIVQNNCFKKPLKVI